MKLEQVWSHTLNNNIAGGGVMPPITDPFNPLVFYISDGWGSYYSSMRLRKLSVETGEELSSILIRDSARCLHIERDRIFIILNKRILEADRESLQVLRTFKKGVPLYMDHVGFDGGSRLVMMNWMGGFLNVFDLNSETVRKKKTQNCCGIWREAEGTFLVMNGRRVHRYDLETHTLKKLTDTQPYTQCKLGESGKLYLLCKEAAEDTSKLVIYQTAARGEPQELVPGGLVNHFVLSPDETNVLLIQDHVIWLYSLPVWKPLIQYDFQYDFLFEDGMLTLHPYLFTYHCNKKRLTCWQVDNRSADII